RGLVPTSTASAPTPMPILRTEGLDRIDEIDVDERVATVEAGVPLTELHSQLADRGLALAGAFPARWLADLGFPGFAMGTVGGLVCDPRESPCYPSRGRLRDQVLGLEAIRGDGTPFKAGGRVVKNVTGYDLTRLLVGSRGRLGVITRLHLRLESLPDVVVWASLDYPDDATLFSALADVRLSGREPLLLAVDPHARRVLIADAGRREVVYLQLGRLLERLARPVENLIEMSGAMATLDDPGRESAPAGERRAERPATLRIRVRLPFRRWTSLIRALPLTRLDLEWESIHPFAHFGIARVEGEATTARQRFEDLRRVVVGHGGSAVAERWPSGDWNGDPFDDDRPSSAMLLHAIGTAWDPRRVLWGHRAPGETSTEGGS
ncbi:MAG: FAD-binding oxidoreductase, partial [Planctomycetes bacterium]|nr:FAD-binding oxidoreductase [Planctomycetota bacterium]